MSAMSVSARPVKFTYEDFLDFPDDGRRHELLDGEHLVTPSPNRSHQHAVVHLTHLLHGHVRGRDLGRVFTAPFDVVLSNHDVLEPDLLFISRARIEHLTEANVQGPPDLVIEILSPGTARIDLGGKRRAYEKFGVREYWIVDPRKRSVTQVEFGTIPGGAATTHEGGTSFVSALLPGLVVAVAEIFED